VPSKDVPAAGVRGADVDSYGAQQNYRYLSGEEEGAYAHNNNYAKLLIFDSIDWLDDGEFDGLITIPAEYPAARTWYGAGDDGVALRPGSEE